MKSVMRITVAAVVMASTAAFADGVVGEVVKAPITPDGDVAGAPTDLVIDLSKDLDPDVDGFALPQGCQVRVTLPDEFAWTGLPVQTVFTTSPLACVPIGFPCTTGILLQGWPQHPILPVPPPPPAMAPTVYQLTQDPGNTNTMIYTALTDIDAPNPSPAPGPGLKQIHLINGFTNPRRPGFYPIEVEFTGGAGCSNDSGVGHVHIIATTRPSVHVTSVLNPPANPNTIYQVAPAANADAPWLWDLLLWDRTGMPMLGVSVVQVNPKLALLRQLDSNTGRTKTVGRIVIDAPFRATGQSVAGGPSTAFNAPVKGIPTALLRVQFTAGSMPGRYTSEVRLNGGNSMTFFVDVE